MSSVVLWSVLPVALFGCKNTDEDGDGVEEAPPYVEFLGERIDTPNVAAAVCGFLYDGDQNGEVDGSMGKVTIVGTTADDPCTIVETGNPPLTGKVDYMKVEAQFNDLDWTNVVDNQLDPRELLEFGTTYSADESATDAMIRVQARRVEDGNILVEAGGPPFGNLILVEETLDGLHFKLQGTIGYVNVTDGENSQADPLETFEIEWDSVPTCPAACEAP